LTTKFPGDEIVALELVHDPARTAQEAMMRAKLDAHHDKVDAATAPRESQLLGLVQGELDSLQQPLTEWFITAMR
jgi:hypothetical protein